MEKLILLRVQKSFLSTFLPFDSTKKVSLFLFFFVFERDPHRVQGAVVPTVCPTGSQRRKDCSTKPSLAFL